MPTKKEIEYSVCAHAIGIIADLCAINREKLVELLTGWAWDEEEAGQINRLSTEKGT